MFYTWTDETDTTFNDKIIKQTILNKMKQETFFIPIKLLKEVSDQNHKLLNRSVDVDILKQHYPNCVGVITTSYMEHYHAFGEEVEQHYRLLITDLVMEGEDDISIFLTQDITKDQFELLELVREVINED